MPSSSAQPFTGKKVLLYFSLRSSRFLGKRDLLIYRPEISALDTSELVFSQSSVFSHMDVAIKSTPETMEHRLIRTKQQRSSHQHQHRHHSDHHKSIYNNLIPEFSHVPRPDITLTCQPCHLPKFLFSTCLRVSTPGRLPYCYDRSAAWRIEEHNLCTNKDGMLAIMYGYPELAHDCAKSSRSTLTSTVHPGGILGTLPPLGWSNIIVPGKMSSIILNPILFIENKFNDVLDHCAFHTTGFR